MFTAAAGRVVDLTADADAAGAGRRPALAVAWFVSWAVLVVLMAAAVSSVRRIPFAYALTSSIVDYSLLAGAAVGAWHGNRLIQGRPWSRRQRSAAHLVLSVLLIGTWQLAFALYLRAVTGPGVWNRVYRDVWPVELALNVFLYAGVAAVIVALQADHRARVHERRQQELQLLARDAELRALTAQLEPHFLLNTLNSVLALIDGSPRGARAMIEQLADFLRAVFDLIEEREVPLSREIALTTAYLRIEQARFADRLAVTVEVPDGLQSVRVPPFLLQPVVENAIKHGIAPFSRSGWIAISAGRDGDLVRIEVRNSGPPFGIGVLESANGGLALTRRRIEALCPGAKVSVRSGRSGECVVAVTFQPC